jgi:hypothetical protein
VTDGRGTDDVARTGPRYLWHYELHQRVGNERLVFILVGFDPTYHRGKTVAAVKTALAKIGVISYAVWELVGEYDLMIQLWLPGQVKLHHLLERIGDALPGQNADMLSMVVDSFDSHWMWPLEIDFAQAESLIEPRDYVELNGPQSGKIPEVRLKQYLQENYVHELPHTKTIKFFVRVTNPSRATTGEQWQAVLDQLRAAVKKVQFNWASLMRVRGDDSSYLLTGRVLPERFEDIGTVLGDTLGQSDILEYFGCRTITHISALSRPLDRREQLLSLPDLSAEPSHAPSEDLVVSWLHRPESDDLEFKASAYTDVDFRVGRSGSRPQRAEKEQVRGVAKAVCGMLNAAGGTVVVGVAELVEYALADLRKAFGDVPEISNRALLGADHEWPDHKGWDSYQRRLARDLRNVIPGGVDGWLRYQPVAVRERTLCVIRVSPPPKYFYLRDRDRDGHVVETFYGRMGGETVPLAGQAMDDFRAAHPRTTRGTPE